MPRILYKVVIIISLCYYVEIMWAKPLLAGSGDKIVNACLNISESNFPASFSEEGKGIYCECVSQSVKKFNSENDIDITETVISMMAGEKPEADGDDTAEQFLQKTFAARNVTGEAMLGCAAKVPMKYIKKN